MTINVIEAMFRINEHMPIPATILGALPKNKYETKTETIKNITAKMYSIIASLTS